MDDVGREIAFAKLAAMKQEAIPRRELIRLGLLRGSSPEYLSMRYGVPVEAIMKAKAIWDSQEKKREHQPHSV
jgi:hypothetical protein